MKEIERIEHLATLINHLADTSINEKEKITALTEEINLIAGRWHTMGRSDSSLYISAIKLDGDGTLLKKVIKAYVSSRINYVQEIRVGKQVDFDFHNYINDRYFILSALIEHCGEFASLAIAEIKSMLISDDPEIEWVACNALKGMGVKAIEALPEIFSLMQKRGINKHPYTMGEILVQLSNIFPEIITALKLHLFSDNTNLLHATLFTCSLMDEKSASLYEPLIDIAKSRTENTKSLAILALGSTGKKDEDLCELLLENATAAEWYIRGNAINSMGKLQVSPEKAVPIIIKALDDTEGHDWNVQERAIAALVNYGSLVGNYAVDAIAKLKAIRKALKDEQQEGWICQITDVNDALKKIRSALS
ncbi:HEAT repeat domain-containing protein [Pseudanabaena sp. UWO310]|uniref:HEAT repeat domain-containing protein n=1 Tax=Pseudanabaena sp. UWO310 TaxID=2480795 RepID=UPI00115A8F90|nr:HEAT repeat domain-containing protein [Pseudanabaena sp. UWO310]TYQ27093.1 HEAT repeat domain-containing protein [Pseudanabaena sp. UWO310]